MGETRGQLDEMDVLAAFFLKHRPLPCSTYHPEQETHWYACTCKAWASNKTKFSAEHHHINEFERHTAEALLADGWRLTRPGKPAGDADA